MAVCNLCGRKDAEIVHTDKYDGEICQHCFSTGYGDVNGRISPLWYNQREFANLIDKLKGHHIYDSVMTAIKDIQRRYVYNWAHMETDFSGFIMHGTVRYKRKRVQLRLRVDYSGFVAYYIGDEDTKPFERKVVGGKCVASKGMV